MTVQEKIQQVRSGICKIEFYESQRLINSGTGFVVNEKIITNNHVLHPHDIVFDNTTPVKFIFGDGVFLDCSYGDITLIIGSVENENDYAVIEVKGLDLKTKYNFSITNTDKIFEGDEILVLGYPFETRNLTSHFGRISSVYDTAKSLFKIIQIDSSVNSGNSGGPLLHVDSGEVIGIITRKQTGLADNFDDLIQSFNNHVAIFTKIQQNVQMNLGGVDVIEFFKVSQNQMKIVAYNLKRSANTGIGFAFSCEQLVKELI